MKRNIKYIFLVLLIGILPSCKEEFLEETNPNETATDNFWSDLNDTNAGLNAAYSSLLNHFVLSITEEAWKSDMGWPGYGRPTPTATAEGVSWYYKTYTDGTNSIRQKWEGCYLGIFRANQVIEALNNLEGTVNEEEWKIQMGQARFLRGLLHFYLYSTYNNGEIILRDFVPRSQEDFNKGLSPAAEVLAFFREDLDFAYKNLPAKYEENVKTGRATAGAAATILGTSYLHEGEIDLAIPLFDDVINNPEYGYRLVTDMDLLFTTAGEFNDESIFEIVYNEELRSDLTQWDEQSLSNRMVNNTTSSIGCFTPAWLASKYKNETMDPLDDRNYYIDPIAGKVQRNVPLRASAMVALVEDEQTEYYLTDNVSTNMKNSATGWGFAMYKKYTNHDYLEDENDLPRGTWNSGKNVVVNRLAEVYLMLAECYISKGQITEALALINDVRARWGVVLLGPSGGSTTRTYDNVVYTEATLMDHLMYVEKPLELSIEGHATRWIDLRRWGKIGENFEKLSNETYYLVDYLHSKMDGTTATRFKSSLVLNPGALASIAVDYEYDLTAVNYNPELHDYLPIPSSEVVSNPNIK